MAVTKILARNSRPDVLIRYATQPSKTEEQILTAYLNCEPGHAYQQMMDTKRAVGKEGGRQCYHIIQSFAPGEITPELALKIATEFAKEYLSEYQVVIDTHVDRHHVHSHIVFNSVNMETGEKYICRQQDYYTQIRAISDRLCREHGLSVIMNGTGEKSMSYLEWLRIQRGQPTYRAMLKADMERAIEDANTIGEFYQQMERMGYEIKFGNRLSFRYSGQERYICPERRDSRYSEEGIRNAIAGNLEAIALGQNPLYIPRTRYRPCKKHPKYTGFLGNL